MHTSTITRTRSALTTTLVALSTLAAIVPTHALAATPAPVDACTRAAGASQPVLLARNPHCPAPAPVAACAADAAAGPFRITRIGSTAVSVEHLTGVLYDADELHVELDGTTLVVPRGGSSTWTGGSVRVELPQAAQALTAVMFTGSGASLFDGWHRLDPALRIAGC